MVEGVVIIGVEIEKSTSQVFIGSVGITYERKGVRDVSKIIV